MFFGHERAACTHTQHVGSNGHGTPRTSSAVAPFSSTSILTNVMLPACLADTSDQYGAIARQGPHQLQVERKSRDGRTGGWRHSAVGLRRAANKRNPAFGRTLLSVAPSLTMR
jgi:hypothetical protein